VTSWAYSRPRRRLGPPRITRSGLELRLARRSLCPHCGRMSPTVQGVCTDCWGSKGGQQFWARKDQRWPVDLSGVVLALLVTGIPTLVLVLLWIWD
jgi:hypothetical protein